MLDRWSRPVLLTQLHEFILNTIGFQSEYPYLYRFRWIPKILIGNTTNDAADYTIITIVSITNAATITFWLV